MDEKHEPSAIDLKKIIKALNQKPVAYYPIYRQLMGSVAGGVLLSQIMFWYSTVEGDEFEKNDAALRRQTGLSEWEFKTEKLNLKELTFIEISLRGVPATTRYKIDIAKFTEILSSLETVLQTGKTSKLVWRPSSEQVRRPSSKLDGRPSSKLSFIEIKRKIKRESTAETPINGVHIRPEPEKICVAENVLLSAHESAELSVKFGDEFVKLCIERLDNYKGASGKKYKSDYRAILNWVVSAVKEDQFKTQKQNGGQNGKPYDRTLAVYESAMRACKIQEVMHAEKNKMERTNA